MGKPNPQNLKPWPKGKSGNPRGPLPHKRFEEEMKEFMREVVQDSKGNDITRMDAIKRKLFEMAMKGNPAFMKMALERTHGLPAQDINIGGQNGTNPVDSKVEIVFVKPEDKPTE